MTYEEIIQQIAAYCKSGKLNGVSVYTTYCDTTYCAENFHVVGDEVWFTQSWGPNYCHEVRGESHLSSHVYEYVLGVLRKIEEIIKIDKNLFQL